MRRTHLLAPLVVLIACSPSGPLGTPTPTAKAPYTMPPPTPTLSAIATVAPTGHGRPYTPDMVAVELQDVSYNFPPGLQSTFVATAFADRVWSYDGRPYRDVSIAGSCNDGVARICDVTLVGLPAFAPTRDVVDVYWFIVDLQSPVVGPGGGQALRGFPPELAHDIDTLARSLDTDSRLNGEALRSVEWMLPPPDDAFVLTYGDDNEGDTMYFVTLDRTNREILSIDQRVCC